MKDIKTNFYNRFKKELSSEYTLLSEYVDYNHTKIKVRHNVCGNEYEVLPATIFKGHGCAECFGNKKYTTKSFKEKVKSIVGDEYTVLGEYTGNKNKLLMRHNKCGNEYEVKPNVFFTGSRCPNCAKNKKYDLQSFKSKVKELVGNEYDVLGDFVNARTKLLMKHNKCNCEYLVAPSTFISGSRCPACYKSVPYTTEEYKKKVYDIVGDRYTVLGEYKRAEDKIEIRHNICGNVYKVNPLMFFVGNRCPKCSLISSRSLPEEVVAYFVSQYFDIEQSYRPDWLRLSTGNNGEIDIWIPELKIGIEYDGRIHGKSNGVNKDLEKNLIINNSNEIRKLYRIRENNILNMPSNEKIVVLNADKMISLTSNRGIKELEIIISKILFYLCNKNIKITITNEIINTCRNKVEDYYQKEGKRRIKRKVYNKGTTEQFKERVKKMVGNEYDVLSEYTSALSKIKMRHNVCGNIYDTKPNYFLSGRRCPNCAKRKIFTPELYKKDFEKRFKKEFCLIDDYQNSNNKIRIKHLKCQNVFEVRPLYFLKSSHCPFCIKKVRYTNEMFVNKVKKIHGDEYTVLGEYTNSKTKILMKHNKCGHEYMTLPTSVLLGKRCPKCYRYSAYTTEEISEKINVIKKGEYELKSEYIDNKTPIIVKHNICGNEFNVNVNHFLKSNMKCKICKK